jgi:hypothetical protein
MVADDWPVSRPTVGCYVMGNNRIYDDEREPDI